MVCAGLSFGGGIEEFLDSLTVELSAPQSIEAQKRGYYLGGGVSYSAPRGTFQPFRVVPPSVRSGCGGIDIAFGSFSYLKPEYFVEFAKQVIAQAPGFAFDIALETMCPQCSSVMKKLTALANQINSMSLDSCQLLSNLSNKVKAEVLNSKISTGASDSWLDSVNSVLTDWTETMNEFNNYLSNLGCTDPDCYAFAGYNSIADRFYARVPPQLQSEEIKYFVRAIFGDFIRRDPDGNIINKCTPPLTQDVVEAVEGIAEAEAEKVKVPGWNDNGNQVYVSVPSIRHKVKSSLEPIIDKIVNKQPLDSSELEFLARFDFPALKLLEIFAPSPSALKTIQPALERYLAWELTEEFISSLGVEYQKIVAKVTNLRSIAPDMNDEAVKCLSKTKEGIGEKMEASYRWVLKRISEKAQAVKGELLQKFRFAKYIYELEREVYSRFSNHPIVSGYMFGKALMK